MKTEAQRIAIAEACGWNTTKEQLGGVFVYRDKHGQMHGALPNFLSDLNAMAEAERSIKDDEPVWAEYEDELFNNGGVGATATQRAEAFLRTIGRWTDGESEEKK